MMPHFRKQFEYSSYGCTHELMGTIVQGLRVFEP